jgi:outer membrane lipoprotein SlyB
VVESRESPSPDEPALLQLAFDAVTVNGVERPLVATVVEMEVQAGTRDSNTRTAAKVGVGAAAGAIVGRILGRDRESTVKGAVVGGVAGTAAAIVTRDGHATLEPGARLVIRLDEALLLTP